MQHSYMFNRKVYLTQLVFQVILILFKIGVEVFYGNNDSKRQYRLYK